MAALQGIYLDTDGSLLNARTLPSALLPAGIRTGANATFHSAVDNNMFDTSKCVYIRDSTTTNNGAWCAAGVPFRRLMVRYYLGLPVPAPYALAVAVTTTTTTTTTTRTAGPLCCRALPFPLLIRRRGHFSAAVAGSTHHLHDHRAAKPGIALPSLDFGFAHPPPCPALFSRAAQRRHPCNACSLQHQCH